VLRALLTVVLDEAQLLHIVAKDGSYAAAQRDQTAEDPEWEAHG
jgi:hypothetical protein